MKKTLFILSLTLFFSGLNASVQLDPNEFSVKGIDMSVKFYSDSLFGARGDGLRMGGTVSTLDFTPSFTSYNPAVLAFLKSPSISFSGIPFEVIGSDFIGFVTNNNFNDQLKTAIDDSLSDALEFPATVGTSKFYAAQANGVSGMEGMLPFAENGAAVAAAREERFGLNMKFFLDTLKINADISDDSFMIPGAYMNMTVTANMTAGLDVKSIVTSFGIGKKLNPQFGVGAVLEHVDTLLKVNAHASANAAGNFDGNNIEYNTDSLNTFDHSLTGEMRASAWALRVGASFHAPEDAAEIGLDFSIQPLFKFGGRIDGVSNNLPDDLNVISNEYTSLGRTFTEREEWSTDGMDVRMKLPSYMRVSLAWKPGPAVIALNYTKHFDELGFYVDSADTHQETKVYMQDAARIGFNFNYFQIGGGIIYYHYTSVNEDKNESSVVSSGAYGVIPVASLGWIIPFGSNVKTEWEFLAFPLPILKASMTVLF